MDCEGARFEALRNAIYHSARKAFYDRWNRMLSFIIIIAGAAAIGDLSETWNLLTPSLLAAIATTAAAFQLIADFGGKSAKHGYLQRRYYELMADMSEHPGEEHAAKWDAVLHRIYAEEPPPMRALDAVAYNAACQALHGDNAPRAKINFFQNLLRQWYSFPGSKFPPVAGAKSASSSA